MRNVVVYVHGLWFGGGESALLRRRLSRVLGAECRAFSYPSVSAGLAPNAAALRRYLEALSADTLHLVAHSLGGLVTLTMFDMQVAARELPPGRIVLLGSPVRGSRTAQRLAQLPMGRSLLGLTAGEALLTPGVRRWAGGRELGVIAGDLGLGLGRVLGRMDGFHDGTVYAHETDLPGATAQIRLRASHSGMVFSATVARQAAAFLRDGRFEAEE